MRPVHLFHRLRYFAEDAWDEWRHSPGPNLLALTTLTATLFLAGVAILVLGNLGGRVEQLHADVRVQIFLRDDVGAEVRSSLQAELSAREGVAAVAFVDKREALKRYQQWAGHLAAMVREMDENPLPDSFEVMLFPGAGATAAAERIVADLSDQAAVESIRFDRLWLERVESLLRLARRGSVVAAIGVFIAVTLIMACVLRLAVLARQDEIEIMSLVGATPSFIRGPFLVAGLLHGLVAAGVALLLVEVVRRTLLANSTAGGVAWVEFLAADPLAPARALWIVLLGTGVSLVGSYFAVRAPR